MEKKAKMSKRKKLFLMVWGLSILAVLAGIILVGFPSGGKEESITEAMRDAVLHEENKMSLFGLPVNPGLISAFLISGILLLFALIVRIFVIPRFKNVPGKFQAIIEKAVEFFSDMAKGNSPYKTGFVSGYIFSAGLYIFVSTIFELFGVQWITTKGHSMTLPAPLSDINAAIAMGVTSFLIILGAGIVANGFKGALKVLKDFSLPISMSFRLFGALLSGLLVTELVYYYATMSFVLPVIVGILFTLLHALIQAYVLATLVSIFYGEAVEPKKIKEKKIKEKKVKS
ncbi:MAG: F0F1 ATP synthase subunit A [Oscillospiraceae bacterium]|nr:F0F1 ATP synthase subunit A [Oscillospiraceae bacterium]